MRTVLRFVLDRRLLTILLAGGFAALGLWSFTQLSIEAYPDISDTQVVVIALYPGHAAEEMEQQVSVPIERALNAVPHVIARRSRTIFGLSVVELTFEYGVDDYFARQVVLEKLGDVTLPAGVTPTLGPLSTPIGELYRYTLEAPGYDSQQLRQIQDWVIAPRLLQVAGVTDVTPFGGTIKQYQIEVDPAGLTKYGLSIEDIAQAVSSNNEDAGGALLDNRQQALVVRGVGLIQSLADIETIVVAAREGVPVFVRDVGRVHIGPAPRTGIFAIDDRPDRVEGIVLMRRGQNPSQVLQGVHEAVDELNRTTLPPGVTMVPIYDRTDLVNNTLRTVGRTLLEGLTIVTFVLLLFLGNVRAALLTAIVIPLSLLFAFACMYFSGISANLLSLGALDFGIIVDGALVMVEAIVAALSARRHESREGTLDVVRDTAMSVGHPIFFSLLIIVSAYIPLFTLQRVERRLFTPMAFTVCYALLGSLLLTLTLVPVLATYLFPRAPKTWRNPWLTWLQAKYERALGWSIDFPRRVIAVSAVVIVAAGLVFLRLGSEFLPQLDEGTIWIRANFASGISLDKSAELASTIRTLVRQSPEVKTIASQSGRNDDGTDPYGPNRNELFVALTPYDTWAHGRRKSDLVKELDSRLRGSVPGAFFSFTQPIIDNVTEAVTGSPADLAIILTGPDLAELRRLGEQTLGVLREVDGAADTGIEQEEDQAQLRIRVDRGAVARYGINVRDVEDVIELAIGGRTVSTFFEGERRFDITVRDVPEARSDPLTIGAILVTTRDGGRVPLSQLAEIRVVNGASLIARRENRRQISVRTNIRGRDQGGFVAEAQRRFAEAITLPDGYRVEWGGQFENLARARHRLAFILPVTIAVIFALLFVTFGSVADAGVVLLNVPFSIFGGILALYVRGINLSVSAAVGFISLFGVAVMSGVLVISEIRSRLAAGQVQPRDAVIQGALARMRPVLMMIVVAMLGMVPASVATGVGSDIQRPLATVVVGGLLSTLALTLLALPGLYWVIVGRSKRDTPANGH